MGSTASQPPTIAHLLNLVPIPNGPTTILTHLASHPQLASAHDQNGYTLLHAASSYATLDLLRTLVSTYSVSPDIADNDGDTPLFYAESAEVARVLVEELGADAGVVNGEGVGVVENARTNAEDGEPGWAGVVTYLEGRETGNAVNSSNAIANGGGSRLAEADGAESQQSQAPPPLPPNVRINVGTMGEDEMGHAGEADPEFRRRIEELAASDDFEGERGQRELRALVEDAVGGLAVDEESIGGGVKRRAG